MEELIAMVSPFLMSFAEKHPALVVVWSIMGAVRMLAKPLFAFLHEYVLVTSSTKDDEKLAAVESSKYLKWFFAFLDYALSIKIKK